MWSLRFNVATVGLLVLTVLAVRGGDEDVKVAPNGALGSEDLQRLKSVVNKGFDLSDASAASYSVLTSSHLGLDIPNGAKVCEFLTSKLNEVDGSKPEPVFSVVAAASKVPSCKVPALKAGVKQALEKIVKEAGASAQDVFYAAAALKSSGNAVDAAKLAEVLKAATKSDDSPQSLGYALWATAVTYTANQKLDIWERIEDAVAQADEVDKQYLQFEGGLSVTAAVINGVFRLAEAANKPVPLSSEQVVKFGNYLVSRKTVNTPRGAFLFSSALDILSKNKFAVPVYVGLSNSGVLTDSKKVVAISASDLLGRPLDINIQLESATAKDNGRKSRDVVFIQALPDSADKTRFSIDLQSKPLAKGFYDVVLVPQSKKNDKALILAPVTVSIKQVGKLGAVTARVGVQDADQQSHVSWTDLNKGQKISGKLELDPAQKLVVKVGASDALHQVFVLLRHKATKRETVFVGQPETQGKTDYKIEIDLISNAKDLNYLSGAYEATLYLGDFLIEDSTEWNLGDVHLTVQAGKPKELNPLYAVNYEPKPEIKHVFRTPDPRPPRFVSDAFTLMTIFPIVILFALWAKIGVNVNGFPASLSALAFHLGLAGVFGVYATFWLRLSMFEALKLVSIPGAVTFLAGHRLLALISDRRNKTS